MSNEYEEYTGLEEIIQDEKLLYLNFDPLISDFTQPYTGSIIISSKKGRWVAQFDNFKLSHFVPFLFIVLFSKENIVLTWDIKRFFSYIAYNLKSILKPIEARVIDLKYTLAYLGDKNAKPPVGLLDAYKSIKDKIKNNECNLINSMVYSPLATLVLPCVETAGTLSEGKPVYFWYEIEGQSNGRMSTLKLNNKFITPHSMDEKQRLVLRPRMPNDDGVFISLDYTNMEVRMLQWLSKDEVLLADLEKDSDFYSDLFLFLFKSPSKSDVERNLAKKSFLPVIFGQKALNLSESLKIREESADKIITRLKERYVTAFEWLKSKQADTSEIAIDCLGRRRDFSNEPSYKRRNFQVQSPAAMVCLEKLCDLFKLKENLVMHIHDGYVLKCESKEVNAVAKKAKSILETESKLCPGLKLTVSCKFGENLENLVGVKW